MRFSRSTALGASLALLALVPGPARVQGQAVQAGAAVPATPSAGWLGFRSTVTVQIDAQGIVSGGSYVRITEVFDEGPADRAGLRAGDVVVGLNGAPTGSDRFQALARRLQPGDPVTLSVLRNGRRLDVPLTAAQRPAVEVMVPRQLQVALDSTRRVFVARLDSVRREISATVSFPHVEVRRIEAAPVHNVLVRADSARHRLEIRTPDGVFEWVADGTATADGSRSFSAWVFRTEDARGADPTAVRVHVGPVREPVRGDAPRPATGSVVSARPVLAGGSEPPAPVRPLAPYLAGMNRVAGAEFTPLADDLATYFQVDHGLLVTDVAEGTPAADAGLVPGDVIVEARGRPVGSVDALRAALSLPDGPVSLALIRRGRRVEVRLPH